MLREEVIVKSNNKVAFLMYHRFEYSLKIGRDNSVLFVFKDSPELQECLNDFYDAIMGRRSLYLDYTELSACNSQIKEIIKSYKY